MSLVPSSPDLRRNPSPVGYLQTGLTRPGPNGCWLWLNERCGGVRVYCPAEGLLQHRCTSRQLKLVLAGTEPSVGPFFSKRSSLTEDDRHRRKLCLEFGESLSRNRAGEIRMVKDLAIAFLDHDRSAKKRRQFREQELHPPTHHRRGQVVDRLALENRRDLAVHLHRVVAAR